HAGPPSFPTRRSSDLSPPSGRLEMAKRGRTRQRELCLKSWGGRRKGAGRKPKGKNPGVPHGQREKLPKHCPAHITLRVGPEIWKDRKSTRLNSSHVKI